jgi:peptidoglycan/LPS O-acetylase OafA/YrhL
VKYIKGLDSLRAFAIIVVLVHHWGLPFQSVTINDYVKKIIIPGGRFGVDLFFVLSGFLITSILLNARQQAGAKNLHVIKNFVIRRALRIFPIYYLFIFFLILIHYPFIKTHLVWFVTYTSNILSYRDHSWNPFSHTWSLAVEEQFYLLWPWLIIYVPGKYLKYIFLTAIGIGIASTFLTVGIYQNEFGTVLLPSCLHAFGIGGLYAYANEHAEIKKIFLRVLNILFPLAILIYVYWISSPKQDFFIYWFRVVNCIISIWMIHKIIHNRSPWIQRNFSENRLLNTIGKISYGIYLYHGAVHFCYTSIRQKFFSDSPRINSLLSNFYFVYFIEFLILFAVSYCSFYLLEKPIMKLKDKFRYD